MRRKWFASLRLPFTSQYQGENCPIFYPNHLEGCTDAPGYSEQLSDSEMDWNLAGWVVQNKDASVTAKPWLIFTTRCGMSSKPKNSTFLKESVPPSSHALSLSQVLAVPSPKTFAMLIWTSGWSKARPTKLLSLSGKGEGNMLHALGQSRVLSQTWLRVWRTYVGIEWVAGWTIDWSCVRFRVSCTKCALFTPISPSTASSKMMDTRWRFVTFWARRYIYPYEVYIRWLSNLVQTVRHVKMLDGVTVSESKAQKDELLLTGNDIENVSQSGTVP